MAENIRLKYIPITVASKRNSLIKQVITLKELVAFRLARIARLELFLTELDRYKIPISVLTASEIDASVAENMISEKRKFWTEYTEREKLLCGSAQQKIVELESESDSIVLTYTNSSTPL